MPTFFASDFHFGVDARTSSRERERAVVAWLDYCMGEGADAIYLVGDLFEFWFEWREAIPRGYVRFLGKLAEVADAGIPLHIFSGNHDMWMEDYLVEEIGARVYHRPIIRDIAGRRVMVGHGDGLGPGDHGYKRLKRVMNAGWARWMYARLHPNTAIALARWFSGKSRASQPSEEQFLGPDNEWLLAYSERKLAQAPDLDLFVFGHRHLPIDYQLSNGSSRYVNLGEWLSYQTFLRLDRDSIRLLQWKDAAPAPLSRGATPPKSTGNWI